LTRQTWVLGEFATPQGMLGAVRHLRRLGYKNLDTYSPYPVEGSSEALGLPRSRVALFVLVGGLVGATLGYLLQYFCNVYDFPINIGGRPPHSPPTFIPITFEVGVLLGAFSAFFGVMALMRLPKPYHPVFEVEAFRRASIDRFWVSIAFAPAEFEKKHAAEELSRLGALQVATVVQDPASIQVYK